MEGNNYGGYQPPKAPKVVTINMNKPDKKKIIKIAISQKCSMDKSIEHFVFLFA